MKFLRHLYSIYNYKYIKGKNNMHKGDKTIYQLHSATIPTFIILQMTNINVNIYKNILKSFINTYDL